MGRKPLSIFNSKNIPGAFLITCVMLIVTSAGVSYVAAKKGWSKPFERYDNTLKKAQTKTLYRMIFFGDSIVGGLNYDILNGTLFGTGFHDILPLTTPGNSPRDVQSILEKSNFQAIQPGTWVVIGLAPVGFNRHNDNFLNGVETFFSWKEFFEELVLQGRWDNVTEFLIRKSPFALMAYRFKVRECISIHFHRFFHLPDAKAFQQTEDADLNYTAVKAERLQLWRTQFLRAYVLDPYQKASALKIIRELKEHQAHVILMAIPVSSYLRDMIGGVNVKDFCRTVDEIAHQEQVPFLDYVSGVDGHEWDFRDGIHLYGESDDIFSRNLASDIQRLLSKH